MKQEEIVQIIKHRRSIFPARYNNRPIERATIMQLLECANQAPSHKLTEPWRFKVFRDKGLERLADELVNQYGSITPADAFLQKKSDSIREKVMASGAVIAICIHESGKIPVWEEMAAVACAVQNMWLAASAQGIGSYWSTPVLLPTLSSFLDLAVNERCIGLFYLGYHNEPPREGKRAPIAEKTVFIEE